MYNIMWKYLDKRDASISALKDYQSMQYIIDHTDREIIDVQSRLNNLSSISLERSTKTQNPTAFEERVAVAMDHINVLKKRYEQAKEYMDWFDPAWKSLSEAERHVLSEFYLNEDSNQGYIIDVLCSEYNIERTSVYKKKNRALDHLTILLYGK